VLRVAVPGALCQVRAHRGFALLLAPCRRSRSRRHSGLAAHGPRVCGSADDARIRRLAQPVGRCGRADEPQDRASMSWPCLGLVLALGEVVPSGWLWAGWRSRRPHGYGAAACCIRVAEVKGRKHRQAFPSRGHAAMKAVNPHERTCSIGWLHRPDDERGSRAPDAMLSRGGDPSQRKHRGR